MKLALILSILCLIALPISANAEVPAPAEKAPAAKKKTDSKGCSAKAEPKKEIKRDIKEKLAYVAEDFDEEMEKAETSSK